MTDVRNEIREQMTNQETPVRPFAGAARAEQYVEIDQTTERPIRFHLPEPEPEPEPTPPEPAEAPVAELAPAIDDFGQLATVDAPAVATSGIRGLVAKTGIKVAPSRAEADRLAMAQALRRDEDTIRQATWTRAVSILVANRKGGVGKTPTAVIVGGILASIRGGSVAVMEVSDDPGTLTFRTEGTPSHGIGELVRDSHLIRSAGQLAGYTAPQTSFASVIGTVGPRPSLTADDVVNVARVVDEYYTIRVMDSGNQPSSSAFEGATATADAIVIPVLNSADVILEAVALIDQLRASGPRGAWLADRAIIIRLTDGRPEQPALMDRLTQLLEAQHVAGIYSVPCDAHIAERGPITVAKLAPVTRTAFVAATAGVVRTLQIHPLSNQQ